jgi:hypothetical protein
MKTFRERIIEKFDICMIRISRKSWTRIAKRSPLQHFILQELINRMATRPITHDEKVKVKKAVDKIVSRRGD